MSTPATTSCLRCNRSLTAPKSVANGYGPVCASKLKNQRTLEEIENDESIELIVSDRPSNHIPEEALESQEELYKARQRAKLGMQQNAFVEHRRSI
jgi:ASC-1-like (ASCH) protein